MSEIYSVDLTFNFIDEYSDQVMVWLAELKQQNENIYFD